MNRNIECIDGYFYPASCVIRVERYGDKFYGIYGEQLVAKDLYNYEIAKEASKLPLSPRMNRCLDMLEFYKEVTPYSIKVTRNT